MDLSKKVHLSVSFPAPLIQHVQNNLVVLCADADAGRLVLIAVHQKRTDFILHLFANQTAQVARAALPTARPVRLAKDDHLSGLREQILAQREALLKQSELLRRRADALDAFEKRLAYAQAHLDEPAICDRPPLRLLRPSLSELSAADMESRRSLDAFIAAMPDTRISFARALAPKSEKHFRLCADEAACAAWDLPLEHTAGLPSARCVRVIHRFACQPWDDEAMPELTAIGRKAGYAIAEDQPYLGLHLATENHQEHIYFYATFYLPVLEG